MSTYYTSRKIRFNNAEQFKESFSESVNPTVGYMFISNHIPYEDEEVIPEAYDTAVYEKSVWDNMIAAKKITGTDLEYVIPNNLYANNVYYMQYDDTLNLEVLITGNVAQNIHSFYVVNSENSVYKCLSNNNSSISTIEPTGYGEGTKGIVTTTDSYVWKYMYTVPEGNKFTTNTWIPAPVSTNRLAYSANTSHAVDGELIAIVVSNPGTNYYNGTINVSSFLSACSILTYDATTDVANTIAVNMELSGNGITFGTYITNVDTFNRQLILSYPTETRGGGSGNTISTLTRSVVVGDGFGAICNTYISGNSVDKIVLTSFGEEYNYADVIIYGTGEDASARPILGPKYGHSFNSAKELGCNTVLLNVEVQSSNNISSNTTFRQYGLLVNPHKYGESTPVLFANAQSTISQTTNVTLLQLSGDFVETNKFVYQGSVAEPSFSGVINEVLLEEDTLKLTNVRGTIEIGPVLKTNATSIAVSDISYPEFQPYSGDILHAKNIESIQRAAEQTENIKVIVKF